MCFATALPDTKGKLITWLWGLQVQPWQLWSQRAAPAPASQAIPPHPVHALPVPSLHARWSVSFAHVELHSEAAL